MMKLYNYFRSSASFRVRSALELKGLDCEYVAVHIARVDHRREPYAALCADPLVPLLDVDGQTLSQSMAVIECLDELHFCYGSTPTLADCCLVPQLFNAARFNVSVDGLPRIRTAFDACMALPAFQRAQPSACPDSPP